MALKYLDGGRITGLSTDAKPTDVPIGSSFVETDTGAKLIHNGSTWIYDTFESINDAFGKSGGVTQRQHFVEWFTGKGLNTDIWGFGGSSGGTANSVTMKDAIDGGVELIAGSSGWNYVWLSTGISGTNDNDNRPHAALDYKRYSPYGSSIISMVKCTGGVSPTDDCGFGFGTEGSGYTNRPNMVSMLMTFSSAYFKLRSHPASGSSTTTATDVSVDTSYHTHKVDLNQTNDQLTIDGVLKVTHSGKQVIVPMDINLCAASNNNVTTTLNFNYVEAWNH